MCAWAGASAIDCANSLYLYVCILSVICIRLTWHDMMVCCSDFFQCHAGSQNGNLKEKNRNIPVGMGYKTIGKNACTFSTFTYRKLNDFFSSSKLKISITLVIDWLTNCLVCSLFVHILIDSIYINWPMLRSVYEPKTLNSKHTEKKLVPAVWFAW